MGATGACPCEAPRPNPARPGGVRGGTERVRTGCPREPARTGAEAPRPNPARPGGFRGGTERGRTAGTATTGSTGTAVKVEPATVFQRSRCLAMAPTGANWSQRNGPAGPNGGLGAAGDPTAPGMHDELPQELPAHWWLRCSSTHRAHSSPLGAAAAATGLTGGHRLAGPHSVGVIVNSLPRVMVARRANSKCNCR